MRLNLYDLGSCGSAVMSKTYNQQLHVIVSGRVQGVSFRYFTQQTALRLGVKGYVRNRPDGTVEVIAQGKQQALERLLEFLHYGSPSAQVKSVNASWEPIDHFYNRFDIAYFKQAHA